jgi:hypothetical protein
VVLVAAAAGALLGAQVGYLIGRRAGHALTDRARRPKIAGAMTRSRQLLDRYGYGRAIALARFIPVIRTVLNMRMTEVDRQAERAGDVGVEGDLVALGPGQRPAQMDGQIREGGDDGHLDRVGGAVTGQVQQDRVAARALHQRPDRGPLPGPDDEIALQCPATRRSAIAFRADL